ncbi:MAG TPA: outer membrane protein transport protein [Ignavibacteriaceae bacterium]|nr:outer membrane protein transport protein [Ignavibacteriaceae bacterium]
MQTLWISLLVILFFSSNVFAQNVNDALRLGMPGLGSNARALGMGNSFISISDDASAAFFNPAGFGLMKKMEFSGGLGFSSFNNDVTLFNNTIDDNSNNTKLDRISFAFPFPTVRGSLVFGLSYHKSKDFNSTMKFDGFNSAGHSRIQFLNDRTFIPFDLYLTDDNFNTPINGQLNQSGGILNSGSINNWTLSSAIEVHKNLFIGANLNIMSGNFKSDFDYYEDDTRNIYQGVTATGEPRSTDFQTFYLNQLIDWELSGWNAKIGFLYQLENFARIGATVQFPKYFTVKEVFNVNGRSNFANWSVVLNSDDYSDEVQYDIITPIELGAGASFNFRGLIISAEANIIDYSQLEFDNADGISNATIAEMNKEIKELLRMVVNYNIGLEYNIPMTGLRVRGGYFVQPSGFKDDESDYDRKYLTAGLGYIIDGMIGIDLGYAYGWWKDFGDNYGTNLSRTFQDIKVHNFMLTTTYRF